MPSVNRWTQTFPHVVDRPRTDVDSKFEEVIHCFVSQCFLKRHKTSPNIGVDCEMTSLLNHSLAIVKWWYSLQHLPLFKQTIINLFLQLMCCFQNLGLYSSYLKWLILLSAPLAHSGSFIVIKKNYFHNHVFKDCWLRSNFRAICWLINHRHKWCSLA